jgi:LPS-assembly protein
VGRFDINPRASVPVFFRGWSFRPEIALRNTYYTQRKVGSGIGVPTDDPLNRRAVEASIELRPPTLGRIFDKPFLGWMWKHTIEPRFTYRVVNGVTNFDNVIRFDSNDILSDTSELEYALVQRLFLKPVNPKPCPQPEIAGTDTCDNGPHEFVTWELAQRYYLDPDFGGAVVSGKRNMLDTTADLTGFAFLTEPRRFSPIVSRLRIRATSRLDGSWQLDYDTKKGRINASTVLADYHLGEFFLGASHAFMHTPGEIFVSNPIPAPDRFDQFRILLGYGGTSKRGLSSAVSIGFDSGKGFLQYGSWQNSYNWDCCGVSMEYRRFALGTVRNENQFRFAFTLANIGTFGNLKRNASLF